MVGNFVPNGNKCSEKLVWPSDKFLKIFAKWSKIFGKSPQTSLCIVNISYKKKITCALEDTKCILSIFQHPMTNFAFAWSCNALYVLSFANGLISFVFRHKCNKTKMADHRGQPMNEKSSPCKRSLLQIQGYYKDEQNRHKNTSQYLHTLRRSR